MTLDKWFYIGFGFFFSALIIQQLSIIYRIRKISQQTGQDLSKAAETRLSPKESYRFSLILMLFYVYMILLSLYYVWIGKFSVFFGIAVVVVGLFLLRKPFKLARDHRPVHAELSIDLPHIPIVRERVTPESITKILSNKSVIDAIKTDLKRVSQIGYKEQWRLGLLTPDIDTYDLSYNHLSQQERLSKLTDVVKLSNAANQIPVKQAAIINPTTYFMVQANRIMIFHGKVKPAIQKYPSWSYPLVGGVPARGYLNIRELEIDTNSPFARSRNHCLTRFLQEDGFPLRENYLDGDPLTTERGGTIIIDKEVVKVIYLNYYVQNRIIDDEGNLIYMGLDENFGYSSTWKGISIVPSVSKKLYKCVTYNQYIPIVRFRSFPYASDFMLPILDTPMSDSGWADLFIDTRGKAKLYIAKDKSLNEWYEMMEKLRQLFFGELAKKRYHLLGLTKDPMHLHEYFSKKQRILEDYFLIQDWSIV